MPFRSPHRGLLLKKGAYSVTWQGGEKLRRETMSGASEERALCLSEAPPDMLGTKEVSKSTAVKFNQLAAELWLSGSTEGMRLETQPERGHVSGEIR